MTKIEFPGLPEMLCADHIATALNVSKSKAYDLMHSRGFPSIRVGRRMLTPKKLFEAWINQQCSLHQS